MESLLEANPFLPGADFGQSTRRVEPREANQEWRGRTVNAVSGRQPAGQALRPQSKQRGQSLGSLNDAFLLFGRRRVLPPGAEMKRHWRYLKSRWSERRGLWFGRGPVHYLSSFGHGSAGRYSRMFVTMDLDERSPSPRPSPPGEGARHCGIGDLETASACACLRASANAFELNANAVCNQRGERSSLSWGRGLG